MIKQRALKNYIKAFKIKIEIKVKKKMKNGMQKYIKSFLSIYKIFMKNQMNKILLKSQILSVFTF